AVGGGIAVSDYLTIKLCHQIGQPLGDDVGQAFLHLLGGGNDFFKGSRSMQDMPGVNMLNGWRIRGPGIAYDEIVAGEVAAGRIKVLRSISAGHTISLGKT